MVQPSKTISRRGAVAALVVSVAALLLAVIPRPADAAVTAVKGDAYGFFLSVSLFGGPANTRGPSPTVTLPPGGSAVPITATAPSGSGVVGPATFFSSGPLTVSTQGTTGPDGSVTTSTNIQNINTSMSEAFTASSVTSTCSSSSTGVLTGSTTITGGTLYTDSGNDINGDGDYVDAGEHAPIQVVIPTNPAPNTTYDGHIHVNGAVDSFRYVFNEQVVNPDGSLTVYAAHQYLLGPTAVGDLYIGKSQCGLTGTPDPTTTTSTTRATTTTIPATTTTQATTTTTIPATTTTQATTTTTRPATTTTQATTTTTIPATTTTQATTTTTRPATTTTQATTTTTIPATTTTQATTTTTRATTTTTSGGPSTTICKPGNGNGDKNHCHTGSGGGGGDDEAAGFFGRLIGRVLNLLRIVLPGWS